MSKQIIDCGFGVIETRETFYTEETISKLNQQITELKKQLEEKEREIDEFKRIGEKGHFYDLFEDQRKTNRILIKESEQLLQQLKSQPAEIVEKIRKELGLKLKYKLNDEVSVLKICNQINEVLDTILKEYKKEKQ